MGHEDAEVVPEVGSYLRKVKCQRSLTRRRGQGGRFTGQAKSPDRSDNQDLSGGEQSSSYELDQDVRETQGSGLREQGLVVAIISEAQQ